MKTDLKHLQPGILFLAFTWICLLIISVSTPVKAAEFNLGTYTRRQGRFIKPHFKRSSENIDTGHQPSFDNTTETNVTEYLGENAYLFCRIHQLGPYVVMWKTDRDILTIDHIIMTNDQRFTVIHPEDSEYWILQIRYVRKRDTGLYECQISTYPVMSHFVKLNIIVPIAAILEGSNVSVQSGSTITVSCIIRESASPPAYIFWYKDDQLINFDTSRGGTTIEVEYGTPTVSRLQILNAHASDSGNYTCAPSNADSDSVMVQVLSVA